MSDEDFESGGDNDEVSRAATEVARETEPWHASSSDEAATRTFHRGEFSLARFFLLQANACGAGRAGVVEVWF